MRYAIAIAVGLMLAWCVAAPSANALPSGSGSARAFSERLVRSLNDTSNGPNNWETWGGHGGYDPSLVKLMQENDRLARGIDLLDADPLCQCQDVGGHYRLLEVTEKGPDSASIRIKTDDSVVTAILRRTGAVWHVYDVIDGNGSLRAALIRHNACMRAHHTDAAQVRCFGRH